MVNEAGDLTVEAAPFLVETHDPFPEPIPFFNIDTDTELVDRQLAFTAWSPSNEKSWGHLAESQYDKIQRELTIQHVSNLEKLDRVFCIGGRARVEEIVTKGLHEEAATMLQSERQPLKRLERLLQVMRMQDLPDYDFLSNETCDVVQAVNYCEFMCTLSFGPY